MRTVNMREAKTHLSRLVALAAKGEGFILAKAGKPLVKVVPFDSREAAVPRRLGFWRARLPYPTISIAWARARWSANSAVALDPPGGHAPAPLGGGRAAKTVDEGSAAA
jgi:antitoxin (DNA-binding transcriptional repressor) of toxin-antitoxin stability system